MAHRTAAPRDVPGSRLLLTDRAAMLQSGSPPGSGQSRTVTTLTNPFDDDEDENDYEGVDAPLYSLRHLRYLRGMRLLALDPALRSSGFAILEKREQKIRSLAYGVIQIRADVPMSQCLVEIHRQVSELIDLHRPEVCAVESVIFVQNSRTAVTLGAARGSALLAAAQRGLNIFEYAPKRVKQAIVGTGSAQKSQVGFMVRALLGLTDNPDSDAADALAIGLTHLQMQDSALRSFQTARRL
jgi:crossover junction endodeoxyribonuclease RuvC